MLEWREFFQTKLSKLLVHFRLQHTFISFRNRWITKYELPWNSKIGTWRWQEMQCLLIRTTRSAVSSHAINKRSCDYNLNHCKQRARVQIVSSPNGLSFKWQRPMIHHHSLLIADIFQTYFSHVRICCRSSLRALDGPAYNVPVCVARWESKPLPVSVEKLSSSVWKIDRKGCIHQSTSIWRIQSVH